MEGYTEITVLVDGALSEEDAFPDTPEGSDAMECYLIWVATCADTMDDEVEVYTLYHPHDCEVECECMQYVTDHRPSEVYNAEEAA